MGLATCVHEIRTSANLHSLGIQTDQEMSERETFQLIDHQVREWARSVRQWATIARMCAQVQSRKLYKYGGFDTYDAWKQSAFLGVSERTIDSHVSTLKELEQDFTDGELNEIPAETAKVLRKTSKAARRDPEIRRAATQKREKFVETVQRVRPEEHIEQSVTRSFTFEQSAWETVRQAIECYRTMNNPSSTEAEVLECWASSYLHERWEDSPYTNAERAEQLRSHGLVNGQEAKQKA